MRTQLEILKGLRNQNNPDYNLAFLEAILDIRDVVTKEDRVVNQLSTNNISVVNSSTPHIPEKLEVNLPPLIDQDRRIDDSVQSATFRNRIDGIIRFLNYKFPKDK